MTISEDGGRIAAPPTARACSQCGKPIGRRRGRGAPQNDELCLTCDQRARRSAYFRTYYTLHKDRILDKNRKWARENREKVVQLRQARQAREPKPEPEPRRCLDCETPVVRATRCRRCYIRFRYGTDPEYRIRRLATTRRWLERRQQRERTRDRATAAEAAATDVA